MTVDPAAILALIADLYQRIAQLEARNAELATELASAKGEKQQFADPPLASVRVEE